MKALTSESKISNYFRPCLIVASCEKKKMIESLRTVTRSLCDFFSCDGGSYGLSYFENERIGIRFKIPRDCSIQRKKGGNGRFYEIVSNYSDEFLFGIIECLEDVPLQKTVQKEIELIKERENYNSFETVTRRFTDYAKIGYSEYREEILYKVLDQRFSQMFIARTIPSLPQTIFFFTECFLDSPTNKKEIRHLKKRKEMGQKMYKSFIIDLPEKTKGKVTLVNESMKINLPHPCFKTKKKIDGYVCHMNDKVIDVSKNVVSTKKENEEESEGEEEEEIMTTEKKKDEEDEEEIKEQPPIEVEEEDEEEEKKESKEETENELHPCEKKEQNIIEEQLNLMKKKLIINEELNQLLLQSQSGSDLVRIQTHGFKAKNLAKNIKILNEKECVLRRGKSPFCIYRYDGDHVKLKLTYPYYMYVLKEFFTRDDDPLVVIKSERSMMTKVSIRHFEFPLTRALEVSGESPATENNNINGEESTLHTDFYQRNIAVEHDMFDWVERVHSFPLFELQKKLPEEKRRFQYVFRYRGVVNGTSNMVTFLLMKDQMTVLRIHSMHQDNGLFAEGVFNVFRMIHSMVDCSLKQ